MAKKSKEYKRVCKRCDHTWYAPYSKRAPQKPNFADRLVVRGTRMQATGSRVSIIGTGGRAGIEKQASNAQSEYDRKVQAYNDHFHPTCPACGSQSVHTSVVEI